MFAQSVIPVFVSWNTLAWIRVGLRSFREHFPSWQVLVIDNNPVHGESLWNQDHDTERSWLQSQPGVIVVPHDGPRRTHGAALDTATEWCRQQHVEYLLHLEPDCLISGRRWYENLCLEIDAGAWMTGSHRKQYGPIHPTPSLWRVSQIRSSFDCCDRATDETHSRFSELFHKDWLLRALTEAKQDTSFWQTKWDTAQRAWFDCAVADRAIQAEESDDFEHFWFGSDKGLAEQHMSGSQNLVRYQTDDPLPFHSLLTGAPVSEFAAGIGDLLMTTLANAGLRRVVFAGCPRHANTGDLLLMTGFMSAIAAAGIEISQTLDWPEMPSAEMDADAVLLQGGGNLGDLYPNEMDFRLRVCRQLTKTRVIWLSQSIEYRCPEKAKAEMQLLASLDHVEVWLRDARSLSLAMEHGLPHIRLVPDGVFGLKQTPAQSSAAGPRIEVRRSDSETTNAAEVRNDWMLPGMTMLHHPHEAWDMVRRRLDGARIVVTDRLHTHLMCVLSDIPNVLVADRFGKNRAMFLTWTHMHSLSRFASKWSLAEQVEAELNDSLSQSVA